MYANMYGISQVNEIIPGLYLTSVYGATRENIIHKNVSLLINAAQELPKQDIPGVETIKLFLDDTPYALINVYFDRIADRIHDHLSRGGRCMIHCVLGVSRSASLLIAYLIKYKNMSLKTAYDFVSSRRPCVRPNPGFWRQLTDYEKQKLNSYQSSNRSNSQSNYRNETSIPISIVNSSRGSERPGSSVRYQSAGATGRYPEQNKFLNSNPFDTNRNTTTSAVLTYLANNSNPQTHRSSLYVNPESKYSQANKSSDFITTYRSSYGKYM